MYPLGRLIGLEKVLLPSPFRPSMYSTNTHAGHCSRGTGEMALNTHMRSLPSLRIYASTREENNIIKKARSKIWDMLCMLSHVWLSATLRTVVYQAPLSMGFSRQEYWRGLPCPSPWGLPNPGIEPGPPALQVDSFPNLYNLVNTQHSVFECFSIMYSCHFFWY